MLDSQLLDFGVVGCEKRVTRTFKIVNYLDVQAAFQVCVTNNHFKYKGKPVAPGINFSKHVKTFGIFMFRLAGDTKQSYL